VGPEAHPSVLKLLRQGAWFGGLPPALQELILRESVVRSYPKGQVVIREGEPPKGLFAVLEGRVRAVCWAGDAAEVLMHVGEAGLWFGHYGAMSRNPSIGSVIADSPVRLLLLPAFKFERIVADEPQYYRAFADAALERYAFLFRYVAEAHGLSPEGRLRARLADLAHLAGRERPRRGPVALTVSQTDLATLVGVSRQTLNGLLKRLEAERLIEVAFRRIRVLDEARLRDGRGGAARRGAEPLPAAVPIAAAGVSDV